MPTGMTAATIASRRVEPCAVRVGSRSLRCTGVFFAAAVFATTFQAQAQERNQESKPASEARIIVLGEGSVSVPPDYARITSGVTARAKTAKEAADANSKLMDAITGAL